MTEANFNCLLSFQATTLSAELGSFNIQINHRDKILQNIFWAQRDKNDRKDRHSYS